MLESSLLLVNTLKNVSHWLNIEVYIYIIIIYLVKRFSQNILRFAGINGHRFISIPCFLSLSMPLVRQTFVMRPE